jgi:ATP synthase protein I
MRNIKGKTAVLRLHGEKKAYKQLLRFSSIGLEMGFSVAIGVGIGYLLDSYFDTKPWFLLIFFFVGIAAAFRSLFSLLKRFDKDKL